MYLFGSNLTSEYRAVMTPEEIETYDYYGDLPIDIQQRAADAALISSLERINAESNVTNNDFNDFSSNTFEGGAGGSYGGGGGGGAGGYGGSSDQQQEQNIDISNDISISYDDTALAAATMGSARELSNAQIISEQIRAAAETDAALIDAAAETAAAEIDAAAGRYSALTGAYADISAAEIGSYSEISAAEISAAAESSKADADIIAAQLNTTSDGLMASTLSDIAKAAGKGILYLALGGAALYIYTHQKKKGGAK